MEENKHKNPDATAAVDDSSLAKTFKEMVHDEHEDGKEVTWKSFKDGIRLHSAGNAWVESVAEGAHGGPRRGGALARTVSVRALQRNSDWGGGGWAEEQGEAVAAVLLQRPPTEEQPVKMSLMALLADDGGYSDDDDDENEDYEAEERGYAGFGHDEEDDEDGEEEEDGGKMVHECCVCMVRHKGAAFIPCGHTFCRLCSRELWVSRGNCPLCNGFILEILDIF